MFREREECDCNITQEGMDKIKKLWPELTVISVVGALPIIMSLIFNRQAMKPDSVATRVLMYGLIAVAVGMVLVQIAIWFRQFEIKRFVAGIKKHRVIMMVLLVVLLTRLPFINVLPRWDSGEYYYNFVESIRGFEYGSVMEYIMEFRLCDHPTLAWCYIYLIGEIVFPGGVVGSSLISIAITVIAMWCIYMMFLKLVDGIAESRAAIYVLIISMAPLVFSTTTYFNPDYPLAMFFVMALYGCVCKKPVIAGFASLMCLQTKETGLVLIGGLILGIFAEHLLTVGKKGFIKSIFSDAKLYCIAVGCVIQLIYMIGIGGVSNWLEETERAPKAVFSITGDVYNGFGLDLLYIWVKLKQWFILNFNWIVAIALVACIVTLRKYYKEKSDATVKCIIAKVQCIIVSLLVFVTFSMFYITASHARYNVVSDIMLYFLMFYLAENVIKYVVGGRDFVRIKIFKLVKNVQIQLMQKIGMIVMVALLTIQCFYTIDPLTMLSFWRLDTQGPVLCNIGRIDYYSSMYYGDGLIYNTQYQYIDRAYDKILKEVGYTPENMDILTHSFNGCFIDGNRVVYMLNWDEEKQCRVFYENEHTTSMKKSYEIFYSIGQGKADLSQLKDEAVVVCNPYWLTVDRAADNIILRNFYEIGEEKVMETPQGNIIYYKVKLKK